MTKRFLLLLAAPLIFSGCSDAQTTKEAAETPAQTEASSSQEKPMVLAWEDLMPVGEEAILAEMFTEYYEELEAGMAARIQSESQTLSEAAQSSESGDSEFDITSIAEGAANDTMDQIGTFNVVSSLDGMRVRIPGYVVPLDFNAENKYKEFLLVPYFGACLHTPPPPPNQIIYVKAEPGVEVPNIQEPYWLEGTMTTGKFNSDLADTAYEVALSDLEKYDY